MKVLMHPAVPRPSIEKAYLGLMCEIRYLAEDEPHLVIILEDLRLLKVKVFFVP